MKLDASLSSWTFGVRIGISVPIVGDAGATLFRGRSTVKLLLEGCHWPMLACILGTKPGVVRAMTHCAGVAVALSFRRPSEK